MKALLFIVVCLAFFLKLSPGPLSAASATAVDASLVGRYMKSDGDPDYIDIRADGTFTFIREKDGATSDYSAKGNILTLSLPGDRAIVLAIVNGSFTGPDQMPWHKVAGVTPAPAPANLPNFSAQAPGSAAAAASLVEKGKVTSSIIHVSQLCRACLLWAAEHEGRFPATLDDLFTTPVINNKKHVYLREDQRGLLQCPLFKDDGQPGYFYHGAKRSDQSPAGQILFISRWVSADGKRIVGHVDGSAALETPKLENLPGAATAATPAARAKLTPAEEQAGLVQSMAHVKRLMALCLTWAADHGGQFPVKPTDLLADKYLGKAGEPVLHCPLLGDDTKTGYFYHGNQLTAASPGEKVMFYSRWKNAEGKQIVGHLNGSVLLEIPKKEDFMDESKGAAPAAKPTAGTGPQAPATTPADPEKLTRSMGHVKRLVGMCLAWAADHNGQFPESVQELQADKYLGKDWNEVIRCPLQADDRKQGYYYYGNKLSAASAPAKFLFYSHWTSPDGKRIVGHINGSVALEVLKREDYPKGAPDPAPAVNPRRGAAADTKPLPSVTLTAHHNPKFKPGMRYRVSFPPKELPADKGAYVWVVDPPNHQIQTTPLEHAVWHADEAAPGVYKISVEYRNGSVKRLVSNVVEMTIP